MWRRRWDRPWEKLPADRFESATRFAGALNDAASTTALPMGSLGATTRRRGPNRMATVFGVLAALFAVLAAWRWLAPAPRPAVARYGLALAPGQSLRGLQPRTFALALDGSWIVCLGPGSTRGAALGQGPEPV
jgi:hypothetical protein